MSYTPTTWAAGDTVTAAKLNKLEQGVASGGGVLVVEADSNGVLNKTYKEIADAVVSVMRINNGDEYYDFVWLTSYGYDGYSGYYVSYDSYTFVTDSENGYPASGGGVPV